MQKVVYTCDCCEKIIGRKKHITLMMSSGTGTGIAWPSFNGWKTTVFTKLFVHFCSGNCAGKYFGDILEAIESPEEKPIKKPKSK